MYMQSVLFISIMIVIIHVEEFHVSFSGGRRRRS